MAGREVVPCSTIQVFFKGPPLLGMRSERAHKPLWHALRVDCWPGRAAVIEPVSASYPSMSPLVPPPLPAQKGSRGSPPPTHLLLTTCFGLCVVCRASSRRISTSWPRTRSRCAIGPSAASTGCAITAPPAPRLRLGAAEIEELQRHSAAAVPTPL